MVKQCAYKERITQCKENIIFGTLKVAENDTG